MTSQVDQSPSSMSRVEFVKAWLEELKSGGSGERFWAQWWRENRRIIKIGPVTNYEIVHTQSIYVFVRVELSNWFDEEKTTTLRVAIGSGEDSGIFSVNEV